MGILIRISWRNIWRNPRRTWVLISSIAVGVIGYLGTSAFSRGFLNQMVDSAINLQGGHILIAAKGYHENPNIRTFIREPDGIRAILNDTPGIQYAPLVSFQGMISSSENSSGVVINGIRPQLEAQITVVASSIVEGSYLGGTDGGGPQIVIGTELADRLNVGVGEKVVLMTSDLERNINSGAYRVVGLFRTVSPDFDKLFVFLNLETAQRLAAYEGQITAFVIRLKEAENVDEMTAELGDKFAGQGLEVLSWKQRNKLLVLAMELYDFSVVITVGILFVAIAFSIANAFLMVIYERIQEIGIMMANGVLPRQVRYMLYMEALFITAMGTLVGMLVSAALVGYFAYFGLDLSNFAQGLGKFGVGALVYPAVTVSDVVLGLLVINLIVLLSVVYPSFKASRFEVVDAIRFV